MFDYLNKIIPLRQTKKKSVWISNVCPFTGYVSKRRPFRYNSKIGVVKCFCCGGSAKELYKLKIQIEDPVKHAVMMIKNDSLLKHSERRSEIIEYTIRQIKEKANTKVDAIVKSDWDDTYPF